MKNSRKLSVLLLPVLLLASCQQTSNSVPGSVNPSVPGSPSTVKPSTGDSTTGSNHGSNTGSTTPEKDAIELVSTTTTVERGGTITLRVRVNKNIADRTVNFELKNPSLDGRYISFVNNKQNKIEGAVSCAIKGERKGSATVVITMHDSTQTEKLEVPVTITDKLNTPDRVWNVLANKQSYTFTAKPTDESLVTAKNTTVTKVTSKSIVVTDGDKNPIKIDTKNVNSASLINGGLNYGETLNLGGFPMDHDGNVDLEGAVDESQGFDNKSVLTNYFNGDLADIYGITLDKNGKAMYIAKSKKSGEFLNHLQAFTNDNGYVDASTLTGLGSNSYTPFNYLSYYGNNSVRLSADIHAVSGYYGLKAVNSSWLAFDKDYSNIYDLNSYAPVADDTSTPDVNEADMVGMKHAYAKILIWNMMSPTTFVPTLLNYIGSAGEQNFKWSEFAALVDVKINVLGNDNLSLTLSGGDDIQNYCSMEFPELTGTFSNVSSTKLDDMTEVNSFVNRTDLEAEAVNYSDTFNKMCDYINNAHEYRETMYDGSTISIDLYQKDGQYFFIDYSAGYLEIVNDNLEAGESPASKVAYFADADKKAWEVIFNDDYSINTLAPVQLQGGGTADYSLLENQLSASNFYTTKQTTWKSGNPLLATFSQNMFSPFSGYDRGFVSYSPLTWVSVFSDYWTGITVEDDSYGTWMTIVSPTLNDTGDVTKVSMTRAMSQGDSSSYSVFYPNSISACGEGESLAAMEDAIGSDFATWFRGVLSKHTNEIEEINA